VVRIDSPGGTVWSAAKPLYRALREVSEKKPVVAVIGGLGALGRLYGGDRVRPHLRP